MTSCADAYTDRENVIHEEGILRHFAIVLLGWPLLTHATENTNYKIRVNWEDSKTLNDSVVQQCDDTYYSGVEINVPGKARKDFAIEMGVDVTSGKILPGCSVQKQDKANSVTYLFSADSSCTVRVFQMKPKPGQAPKTATYEISDAC